MKLNRLDEWELVDGKPHGGIFFGRCTVLYHEVSEPWYEDPIIVEAIKCLKYPIPKDLEMRHDSIIYRPPYFANPLNQAGTLAFKCMFWGRAWKVYKLAKKGTKKYKKVIVNGRRKKVRVF